MPNKLEKRLTGAHAFDRVCAILTHSVAAISRQMKARSSADLRSGNLSAADTLSPVTLNNVATWVGLAFCGHVAACSTTISRSLIGCQDRATSLMPDRSTQSANSSGVIGPAPFGPNTTIGSQTADLAPFRSPAFTAPCQRLSAYSIRVFMSNIYAIRIHFPMPKLPTK